MTYNINLISSKIPEIAMLRSTATGNLSTSSIVTFEDNVANVTYNGISSGLTITNAGLTLGAGHWQLQCLLGIHNNDDIANNVAYGWYVDGVAEGSEGASEVINKSSIDSSNLTLSISSGDTKDIEMKILSSSGVTTLNSSYSPLIVWKVSI